MSAGDPDLYLRIDGGNGLAIPLDGGTIPCDTLRQRTLVVAERLERDLHPGESTLYASDSILHASEARLYAPEALLYSYEVSIYLPELLAEEVDQFTVFVA